MSENETISVEATVCRVCHQGPGDGRKGTTLIDPCLCDGSIRYVHERCLNQWRLQGNTRRDRATRCELCKSVYQYELNWSSRAQNLRPLLLHASGVLVPIAAVAVIHAILVSSIATAALLATAWLGIWAMIDVAPTPLSMHLGRAAVDNFTTTAQTPRHYAELMKEANIQASARRRSEAQARQLADLQVPTAAPEQVPTEAPEQVALVASSDDAVTAQDSSSQEEAPLAAEGQPFTAPLTGSAGVEVLSDEDDDDVVDFQPHASALQMAPLSPKPARSYCAACSCLSCTSLALGGVYFWVVTTLLDMPLGRLVVWSIAALGASYWGVTFLMQLLAGLLGPRDCTLRRGDDGFHMVRALTAEERRRLIAAAQQRV